MSVALAIQSFDINDSNALCFKKGDKIEILSKPSSDLWEGRCNGDKGWFPSSYVQIIKGSEKDQYTQDAQKRASLQLFDDQPMDSIPIQEPNLQSGQEWLHRQSDKRLDIHGNSYSQPMTVNNSKSLFDDHLSDRESQCEGHPRSMAPYHHWSMQILENDLERFYYNYHTGEIQTTRPVDDESEYALGSCCCSIYSDCSDCSDCSDYSDNSDNSDVTGDHHTAANFEVCNGMADFQFSNCEHKLNGKRLDPSCLQEENICQKKPYQERTDDEYEGNGIHRTDPSNPVLVQSLPEQGLSNAADGEVFSSTTCLLSKDQLLTWDKIFVHIAMIVHKLNTAVVTDTKMSPSYASEAVQAVRYMLYSSGTIEKKSLYIKTDAILRAHHRAMMASLSKLVLSIKLCTDISNINTNKILSDSNEFLIATRNFINTCVDIPITLHPIDPSATSTITRLPTVNYTPQSDFAYSVDAFGVTLEESIQAMSTSLVCIYQRVESRFSLAALLFNQFRNLIHQTGQFFTVVDSAPPMKDVFDAKQELRDSLALLFYHMQTLTDENNPIESRVAGIEETSKKAIGAIQSICTCVFKCVFENNGEQKPSSTKESDPEIGNVSGIGKDDEGDLELPCLLSESMSKGICTPSQDKPIPYRRDVPEHPIPLDLKTSYEDTSVIAGDVLPEMDAPIASQKISRELTRNSSAKLKKFFGDDVPDNIPVIQSPLSRSRKPWYLQYDYNQTEIIFNMDGEIKGGTLPALIERLTLHDYLDMNFINTFLLTYRSFCSSTDFLHLLEGRYILEPPEGLSSAELDIWNQKKLKLIRLRVFSVLKNWLEQYYNEDDSVILKELLLFTNTTIRSTLSFSAHQLERLIKKRMEVEDQGEFKKMVLTLPDPPEPTLPRNLKNLRLLDIDTLELARQLTIIDFKLYSAILPVECLGKAWSRTDDNANVASNIRASIEFCNQVTFWVSSVILSQQEAKKRSSLIKYWVQVAEKCRRLNNFNSCMAILSVFDNSSIGRLKRTWELVGARTSQTLSQIRRLMGANRNFLEYRGLIHSVNPPCIPFLGIYLQDLTFIEDGNKNFLKASKELINFDKRTKTAAVIREIQQYQSSPYQLKPVEELQEFIQASLQNTIDEEELYKKSLQLEPREGDNEKITRLLHESGFL